jgi:lipopolysaccharide export system ATP-binding protein
MAILETRGLVKFYRGRKVVDGVNFEVDLGEVVGLLGPNGAGKTTSFRMITGQVTPNGGTVLFNGKDVAQLPMYRRARLGLGYLPQQTSVFRKLTVEQNILAILEVLPVYRSLGRKLTAAERHKKTDEVLEQFGLSHLRKNNASRLSGGETRRLEIARCLVCDPLIILLDEPFAGIDPHTVGEIQQIIRDLKRQGIGILITDHQVHAILAVTDRLYVIHAGKVLTHGTPQEIVINPMVIKEYLGSNFANDNAAVLGRLSVQREAVSSPTPAPPAPVALAPPQAAAERAAIHQIVEAEKIHRLIERLKPPAPDRPAAAAELLQRGDAAIPHLLEALERRDVDLRLAAFELLKRLIGEGADFDPHAPEAHRRRQLALLRERCARKAG